MNYKLILLLIILAVFISGCTSPDLNRTDTKTNLTTIKIPVTESKIQITITPTPTSPPLIGLGPLCSGEENCKTFCQNNKGICTEYCNDNPENTLCQNSWAYDCVYFSNLPFCQRVESQRQEEAALLEVRYNDLKNEIDGAAARKTSISNETYNRIISDLDDLLSKVYNKEKIDQLKQAATYLFSTYKPPQNQTETEGGAQTFPSSTSTSRIAQTQQWVSDSFTQPVPPGASTTRLVLPASIEKIAITKIGAFGAHQGGHPEGLDHEWIEIKDDVPIGSWGDGEVTRLNQKSAGDYSLEINFGDGLVGAYMEIKTPLVKVGDKVKVGQPIGYGIPAYNNPGYQSGEFVLGDDNRRDGVKGWTVQNGVAVSPFDYLRDDVKQQLISEFTKQAIDPYVSKGQPIETINPWEPYLTNPLLIHKQNMGTIAGEWYLKSMKWATDSFPDVLILLKANTKYYNQNRIIASDEEQEKFVGTWEADYTKKTFVINSNVYGLLYGIFELDESGSRATLKIEYQTGSYPTGFSDKALTYIERDAVQRREDAYKLGVWCMQTSPCEPHCC